MIMSKPGARRHKSGTAAMLEDEALEKERKLTQKQRAFLLMRDREMQRQEEWEKTHVCPKHHVVLARNGSCFLCEREGHGPRS